MEARGSRYSKGADFEELWKNVLAQPDNPAVHDRFINFAVQSKRHLSAAERYGELEDQDLAAKYKQRLALQVAAALLVPPVRKEAKSTKMGWLLIGAGLAFAAAGWLTGSLVGLIGPVAILVGALEIKQSRM
jgi:hypothetical protein